MHFFRICMQIVYGCTTTGSCVNVAAETNTDRYFQLTPSASSTDVTAGKDNVFQVCFTDPGQGTTAADYVADKGLAKKVAVLYNNGDAYSTGIATAFANEAAAKGLEVVSNTTFPDDTNTDFSVQLSDAKNNGAELVFMPIYYTPASLVLNQAKSMDYSPIFFGGDGMDGILSMEGFDTSLAEGLMLMTPFNASDASAADFVDKYKAAFGETPNQFAADGYDCIYAISAACEKAGITADMSAGTVELSGVTQTRPTPASSLQNGVALICEDRRGKALIGNLDVRDNILLTSIDRFAVGGVLRRKAEDAAVRTQINALQIKLADMGQRIAELSGGNQQKAVFARAMMTSPKVFLCDEPTQAVDVSTRDEIHRLLRQKADEGCGVVFVSSDLGELLEVADTVQVMRRGRTIRRWENENLTAQQVLSCCYET